MRIEDLTAKLTIDQMAGLMLYSRHRTVSKKDHIRHVLIKNRMRARALDKKV